MVPLAIDTGWSLDASNSKTTSVPSVDWPAVSRRTLTEKVAPGAKVPELGDNESRALPAAAVIDLVETETATSGAEKLSPLASGAAAGTAAPPLTRHELLVGVPQQPRII